MSKVITIVSTRPCLIRQSLIIKKLDKYLGNNHIVVYTGQNYDENLYLIFLKDLDLRIPDYEFNLKEQYSNHEFIAHCMLNIEKLLKIYNPNDTIINILGDVNGSFASAYVAKRMGFKVFHSEAGNRSGKDILEEINRKCIDTLSHKLLCYTQRSREHLLREGYNPNDIIVIGNPLTEVLRDYIKKIKKPIRTDKYILLTLHRHETINNNDRLKNITNALKYIGEKYNIKIVLSLHPSLADKINKNETIKDYFTNKNIELHKPFNYTDFLNLMKYSVALFSDSGGECEEATILNVPCLILREETERTELFEQSQMILCGIKTENILNSFKIITNITLNGIPEEYTKPTSDIVVKLLMQNF